MDNTRRRITAAKDMMENPLLKTILVDIDDSWLYAYENETNIGIVIERVKQGIYTKLRKEFHGR